MARSERFELPTLGFEVRCSIQLSGLLGKRRAPSQPVGNLRELLADPAEAQIVRIGLHRLRFTGVKGPGLIILIPFAQQMVKVELRVVVQDVPPQDVITRDNVSVKVNAVLTSASSTRSERSSGSRTLC